MEFPSLARRILVVDDDAARAAAMVAVLDGGAKNWPVETALSGRGALAGLTARNRPCAAPGSSATSFVVAANVLAAARSAA